MIDVGGPAMLRAAAKNYEHVTPVCRPDQYDDVLAELRANGELSLETRRRLAAAAFATTAAYESAIAAWFADEEPTPRTLTPTFEKVADLPYGENPHQRAAFYAEAGARRHVLSRIEQLQGDPLSFNNLADLSAARATRGGVRRAGVRDRQAHESRAASRSARRSTRRTRARTRPIPSPRTEESSSATVPSTATLGAPDRRAVRRGAVRARLRRHALAPR